MPLASNPRKGTPQSSSAASITGLDGAELPPRLWGDEQVRKWLASRGIPSEILGAFEDNLVNGLLCEDLSDADLEGMGVSNPLHRKRVLLELARLFGRQSPKASPRSPKGAPRGPRGPRLPTAQENQQGGKETYGSDLGSTTDSIDQSVFDSPTSKAMENSAGAFLSSTGGTQHMS